jgi:hypothetical protein
VDAERRVTNAAGASAAGQQRRASIAAAINMPPGTGRDGGRRSRLSVHPPALIRHVRSSTQSYGKHSRPSLRCAGAWNWVGEPVAGSRQAERDSPRTGLYWNALGSGSRSTLMRFSVGMMDVHGPQCDEYTSITEHSPTPPHFWSLHWSSATTRSTQGRTCLNPGDVAFSLPLHHSPGTWGGHRGVPTQSGVTSPLSGPSINRSLWTTYQWCRATGW